MRPILSSGMLGPTRLAAVAAVLMSGCGSATAPTDGAPTIVVTTSLWADVVSNVVCQDLASVETLIPPGGDPHGFEPSLADRSRLDAAALVVANGLGLEEGLLASLDAVENTGTPVFRMAETVAAPAGRAGDPHVWFDPEHISAALPALTELIVATTDLPEAEVAACTDDYQAELERLDAEVAALLDPVAPAARKLVTNHDALGYFADRYSFEVIGTVIPAASGLAQTSPAALQALAELIDDTGVTAIFVEDRRSTADADALADQVGDLTVVPLYTGSLGDAGSGADSYVGLMRTNAQRIADALG